MTRGTTDAARRARLRRSRRQSSSRPWIPLLLAVALLAGCLVFCGLATALVGLNQTAPLLTQSSSSKFTLLLLGIDQRADESGPTRSDAMVLAGVRPDSQPAALVSIPRDLWVDIPGVGEQRINTALFFGYDAGDPLAGPALAVTAVEQNLGVPVDRVAVIDFSAFVRLVDALGGVEIDVPRPIVDTEYPTPDYGVTTIRFEPGVQQMSGEQALVYARTRHADDDFGRAERQQQVIRAIAARVVNPATWPRLPAVLEVLRSGVLTDVQPADYPALWTLVQAIGAGDVQTATLSDAATPWITPAGAWVLLPDWAAVQATMERLFGAAP